MSDETSEILFAIALSILIITIGYEFGRLSIQYSEELQNTAVIECNHYCSRCTIERFSTVNDGTFVE